MKPQLVLVQRKDDDVSDEALVVACAGGDTAALGTLFDRRQADVRRFLFRLSGTAERDLDDLVQSTFLQALKASARFRGHSSAKTWLYGIAANLVRHHVRGEVRQKNFLHALGDVVAEGAASADATAVRRQQVEQLRAGVARLPHDQRVAFVLCDVEGVSGVESAALLGIPEGTLWRRLHQARSALRTTVETLR